MGKREMTNEDMMRDALQRIMLLVKGKRGMTYGQVYMLAADTLEKVESVPGMVAK